MAALTITSNKLQIEYSTTMKPPFHFFFPTFPSFLRMTSSEYLIPFPLYGSGGLHFRMLAEKSPTATLSRPVTVIFVFSSTFTVIPSGMAIFTCGYTTGIGTTTPDVKTCSSRAMGCVHSRDRDDYMVCGTPQAYTEHSTERTPEHASVMLSPTAKPQVQ